MQKQNRVLVVEDNEINAMVLENMLAYFGLKIDIAFSGKEAVEYAKTNEYSLMFIDYIMPEMDGVETIRRIRMIQTGNPVIIAVTAEVTDELRTMFIEAGANNAYEKPVEQKVLIECLKTYLDFDAFIENESQQETDINEHAVYNERVKELLTAVPGMDFESGLHYSFGDEGKFLRLIKASIKNIEGFLNDLRSYETFGTEANTKLRIITHSLRTVLLNLGIRGLSNDSARLEEATNKNDRKFIEFQLEEYIEKLEIVYQELSHAVEAYHELCSADESIINSGKTVSKEEYRDMIRQVMFPLERYEIEFIIDGLKELADVSTGKNRSLIDTALEAAERFDYDTIRSCIHSLED